MLIRQRAERVRRYRHSSHHVPPSSINKIVRIGSSLIVPVLLGSLTIFITVYQHNSARDDRREDLDRFQAERQEDRNESRMQREQEWNIAKAKQDAQNVVAANRYQDKVLVDYTKEIGALLEKGNGSLTSNRLTSTLARVKTLNVLRQLDGSRRIHVIRFLHESGQLSRGGEVVPLDMTAAELTDIDFGKVSWSRIVEEMSFAGSYLRNCTFRGASRIRNINFTSARFHFVNCTSTILYQVDFSSTRFVNIDLFNTNITKVNFSSTAFLHASFPLTTIWNSNFFSAKIWDGNFSSTVLENVNFSSSWLQTMNFSFARFNRVTFSFVKLNAANFSSAVLSRADFSSAHLGDEQCVFQHALMEQNNFTACNCKMADFTYANLTGSQFSNTNLKNVSFQSADLTRVNFSGANLKNVDLTNTTITDAQLHSALSIQNARLPNGTLGRARNLIRNGDAICNISTPNPWHIKKGQIAVVASKADPNDCQFALRSSRIGANMSQRIDLVDVWKPTLWTDCSVQLYFSRSGNVSIELNGEHSNGTVLEKEISHSSENTIMMKLRKDMAALEITIEFDAHSRNEDTWCDNIELFIDYDVLSLDGWDEV